SPAEPSQYLRPCHWLKILGRSLSNQQLASLRKNDQLPTGADERSESRVRPRPFRFAGRQVDAAKIGLAARLSVECVKIFPEENAWAEMVVQDFFIVNKLRNAI